MDLSCTELDYSQFFVHDTLSPDPYVGLFYNLLVYLFLRMWKTTTTYHHQYKSQYFDNNLILVFWSSHILYLCLSLPNI